MINITSSEVVRNEIERVRKADRDFKERDVEYDISLLKDALNEVNKVVNGVVESVVINCDMWEECNDSLDIIVDHFNLSYSSVEGHIVTVTK